jgi:hypothetical protein
MIDFQSREKRLKKESKYDLLKITILIVVGGLYLLLTSYLLVVFVEKGIIYQCARLEAQAKEYPEVFFLTASESKACPEINAPVK